MVAGVFLAVLFVGGVVSTPEEVEHVSRLNLA